MHQEHQTDTTCAWLVCHSQEGLCKLYPPYPASPEARAPSFLGGSQSCYPAAWLAERQLLAGDIESNPGPKPTLKKPFIHSLNPPTLTKYANSPVQPSQSSPPSFPPPTHRLTHPHLSNPLCPLCKTPTYHRASIQPHTLHLKQHTGPLDVSREGGASASHVERTRGRATITYCVVGPLHSYTQEGWVDNNTNNMHQDPLVLDEYIFQRLV